MPERFVSEPIRPLPGAMDTAAMAVGAPGLPGAFAWRGREWRIAAVVDGWRETGPCRHGSGERYVRKHWFKVRTETGEAMTIYFDRQFRRGRRKEGRWWLFSIEDGGAAPTPPGPGG